MSTDTAKYQSLIEREIFPDKSCLFLITSTLSLSSEVTELLWLKFFKQTQLAANTSVKQL